MFKLPLSALVPVCNDQATLSGRLATLMEVLPELAPRFDVAVIDHGSTDASAEVAHEAAAGYPQLCVLSYPRALDAATVLRRGLQATQGDLVLLWNDPAANPHDFHRLAKAAEGVDAVAGRLPPPLHGGIAGAAREVSQHPALLLFHRRIAIAWPGSQPDEPLLSYLVRKRYRVGELLLRRALERRESRASGPIMSPPAMHAGRSGGRPHAVPQPRGLLGSSHGRQGRQMPRET